MIGKTISQYKILEKLGEGGMGVVYKAEDTKLRRTVALKFLPERLEANEPERARFLQEAQAASALNHPNVCTIYDSKEEAGRHFIVMEYVDGKTLRKMLPFDKVTDAINYAILIGDALHEAHSQGIVHRDVKAENIMVNSKNQVKVMDFGLAKLKGSLKLTKTSSTVGTLAYMAPEQIQGGEVDSRSDIFSFGILLFEMLTGHMPFRGEHEAAVMYSILNEEPESVRKNRADIPDDIDRIIRRALEKDPADRYQHIDDMVSELRRVQKQSARVSRPESVLTSGLRPAELPSDRREVAGSPETGGKPGRSRRLVWFALLLVVVIVAVLGYLTYSSRHQEIDSIAVLPFENVGGDPNNEYLSDGITESIINTLSRLSHLSVMSRTSVFHYKGKDVDPLKSGKELGVKAVLVGRVSQRGDNLEISTELVDVSNSSHIWGEQYSRKLSEIISLQRDIAKEISQQLRIKLVGDDEQKLAKHTTENTEAYQLYLKGSFYWNKRDMDGLQKAADYFNQAIEKDPGYALAYGGLAQTYAIIPEYAGVSSVDYITKTEAAAQKALEHDPTLAGPHAALGMIKNDYQFDWAGAEKELRKAIALDPKYPTGHHWLSNCLECQGRLDEALAEAKLAQELDPLSLIINTNVGDVLYMMKRYDAAVEQLRKTIDLDPGFSSAHELLGWVYEQQGKHDEAISELRKVRALVGDNVPFGLGELGNMYAVAGKREEAVSVLERLLELSKQNNTVSADIATIYAGLGENDKSFEWLEKGFLEHNSALGYMKVDPVWSNTFRSDPRFAALLKKLNLDN